MNRFELNGNKIEAREFDVNLICDMEEYGVDILGGSTKMKTFPTIRAYVACCMNVDVSVAGNELQKHMINGGTLDSVANCMTKAMEDSDFFRAISENEKKDAPTRKNKATSKIENNTEA